MTKTKHDSETPADGQQVISACALIFHDFDGKMKVFLAKRAEMKKFLPGVYELPGGHIDYGEDIVEGLKREVKEEFGMNISVGDTAGAFTYTNDVKCCHSAEVVFFAKFTDPIENITLDPEDHSGCIWVAEDEMENLYTDQKGADDVEFKLLKRGFELLNGAPVKGS